MPFLSQWRPTKQRLWTSYFVHAGRRYTQPKAESFIQTALGQVWRDRRAMRGICSGSNATLREGRFGREADIRPNADAG